MHAIRTEGLGKRYRIGQRERYRTLRDVLSPSTWLSHHRVDDADEPGGAIWALRDVSFEVRPGEVVGVIGRNGSGKTTLLKVLARITEPTAGRAEVYGRVGALLEVGTGFHPELTGRENIYLSGAILGMSRAEIKSKFNEMVAFSGNERFLDTPMKRYSSGMHMRLAFAVAAHLEPEILFVDEVLAVGDVAFQEKCLRKMGDVATSGRTILFVSHNLAAVRKLCTRTLLLEGGQVRYFGPTDDAVQAYLKSVGTARGGDGTDLDQCERTGSGAVRVVGVTARAVDGVEGFLHSEADAEFTITYRARDGKPVPMLNVGIVVVDALGVTVLSSGTATIRRNFRDLPPEGRLICRIARLPLVPGSYSLHVALKDEEAQADYVYHALSFTVINQGDSAVADHAGPQAGSIAVSPDWRCMSIERREMPAASISSSIS